MKRRPAFSHPIALLLGLGMVKLILHAATASRYGFHRDEFYYLAGGHHLAWGFVDHPPFVPAVALLSSTLFGATPAGLRVPVVLIGAATVVLAGVLARELGGGRFAQGIAALATLCAPLFLGASTMLQTVPFDQFWSLLLALGVVHAVRTGGAKPWLLTGLVLGIALLTKYTVLLLGAGLVAGLLFTNARAQLKTPWPWLAAVLALVLLLPNLVWQAAHGWPTLEFIATNNANADTTRSGFLLSQLVLMGVPGTFLWVGGLVVAVTQDGRPGRVLGWMMVVALGALLLVAGKDYYLGPTYPIGFALGALGLETWLQSHKRRWIPPAIAVAFVAFTLPALPFVVPVLPEASMVEHRLYEANENYAEMMGWPELVETVAMIYDGLSPEEQATTTIFTGNYGQAGSLDLLGAVRGLPPAVSGHNSYHDWGPPPRTTTTAIALGFSETYLRRFFAEVEPVGMTTNPYGIPNEEYERTVYLCRGPFEPLADAWADRYHYD